MKELIDTVDLFCKNFCKYNNGKKEKCIWEAIHAGECPFRKLVKEVEDADRKA